MTFKNERQIMDEKLEATELRARIIKLTNSVPMKVLQNSTSTEAATFREHAIKARKIADSPRSDVYKLRGAMSMIAPYYREAL